MHFKAVTRKLQDTVFRDQPLGNLLPLPFHGNEEHRIVEFHGTCGPLPVIQNVVGIESGRESEACKTKSVRPPLQDIQFKLALFDLHAGGSVFKNKEWRYTEMFEDKRGVFGRVGSIDVHLVGLAVAVGQQHTDSGRRIMDDPWNNTLYLKRGIGWRADLRHFWRRRRIVAVEFPLKRFSLGKVDIADKLGIHADQSTKQNQEKTEVKEHEGNWCQAVLHTVKTRCIAQYGVAFFTEQPDDFISIQIARQRV